MKKPKRWPDRKNDKDQGRVLGNANFCPRRLAYDFYMDKIFKKWYFFRKKRFLGI